jgi:hypothetical protein
MKNIVLSFALLLAASAVSAQDSTLVKPTDPNKKMKLKKDQFLIEFTTDGWLEKPENIKTDAYSPGFSVYSFSEIPLVANHIGFAYGYGFSSHNVHHNGYFAQDTSSTEDKLTLYALPDSIKFKKNKVSANYLDLKVELRFRTKGKKPLGLAVGAKGGYLVNFHTKFKNEDNTFKTKGLDQAEQFRYGLTGRISYGRLGVHAWYSMSTLLKSGKGEEIVPYSIGISLSLP